MKLTTAGTRLAKARANLQTAMNDARETAITAATDGVPETRISAQLGVDRMTVRRWLGKRTSGGRTTLRAS